jgi:predicted RNA-binding Zn ribbon-like protein
MTFVSTRCYMRIRLPSYALCDGACDGIVLGLTGNRSRRFSSTTCANRNAVAAHRARAKRSKA